MKRIPYSLLLILGLFPLLPGGLLIIVILNSSVKDLRWGASSFFPWVLTLFAVLQLALYLRRKAQQELQRRLALCDDSSGHSDESRPPV